MLGSRAFAGRRRRFAPHMAAGTPHLALVVAAALIACSANVRGTTLADARQAFIQHDLEKARTIYEHVVSSPEAKPGDRAEASRWLARLDWWFLSQPERARARLVKAAGAGIEVPVLMTELAVMETKLGRYDAARAAARKALDAAVTARDARNARLAHARATVAEAVRNRLAGTALPDAKLLDDARQALVGILDSEPGVLEVSRPLLAISLLMGDGARAWKAWQSYYHVAPGSDVYNLLREPMRNMPALLPAWRGERLPPDRAVSLVRGLSDSRFFPEAAAVALDPAADPAVRQSCADVVAYAAFLRAAEARAEEYYRRTALGQGDRADLLRGFVVPLQQNWTALGVPGKPPELGDLSQAGARTMDAALAEQQRAGALDYLRKRFGLDANFGTTAGYFDAHIGHRVVDEKRGVEQFGHKADVRFIVLDSMVSNGFQSWAWCFVQEHGGWANTQAIWQVRSDDSKSGLDQWRKATEPAERAKWDEEIARESAEDDRRAVGNAGTHLPGLVGRLVRSEVDGIGAALDRRGLRGEARLLAFLAERERERLETAIFAHEGRHLIDRRMGIDSAPDLEFRAKLSEIAAARHPRMVLASQVLNSALGDKTPHGQAQLRIVTALVSWMKGHAPEIKSFDAGRAVLPQADLLSDDQLRAAMSSMDPLARPSR